MKVVRARLEERVCWSGNERLDSRDIVKEGLVRKQEALRVCVLDRCDKGVISVDWKIRKQALFIGGR